MTNECPICGKDLDHCHHTGFTAIGNLTQRVKQLEATVLTHAAQIAALQAASKPAEPAATEKPAKPTITKVGRIWLNAAGNVCHSGWEFDGRLYSSLHEAYIAGHFNLCGYTFDELARESVLKNPRVGDKWKRRGEERELVSVKPFRYRDGGGIATLFSNMNDYIETAEEKTLSDFRPIADAPEANPLPVQPSEQAAPAALGIADNDGVTGKITEKDRRVYYQNIVYEICNTLDKNYETKLVCGTVESPTTQVQDLVKSLCAGKAPDRISCVHCDESLTLATMKAHVAQCSKNPMVQEIETLKAELAACKSATPGAAMGKLVAMLEVCREGGLTLLRHKYPREDISCGEDLWGMLVAQGKLALTERTAPPETLPASVVPMVRALCKMTLVGTAVNMPSRVDTAEAILAALNTKPTQPEPWYEYGVPQPWTLKGYDSFISIEFGELPNPFESKAVKS